MFTMHFKSCQQLFSLVEPVLKLTYDLFTFEPSGSTSNESITQLADKDRDDSLQRKKLGIHGTTVRLPAWVYVEVTRAANRL